MKPTDRAGENTEATEERSNGLLKRKVVAMAVKSSYCCQKNFGRKEELGAQRSRTDVMLHYAKVRTVIFSFANDSKPVRGYWKVKEAKARTGEPSLSFEMI